MDFDIENTIVHELVFWGNSREELQSFPDGPRREAGYQLHKVQVGEQPADFKPMTIVGLGVEELRVRDASGAYRVFYIARFDQTVYVLHAFEKKTQKTAPQDIKTGQERYRSLMKWRSKNAGASDGAF